MQPSMVTQNWREALTPPGSFLFRWLSQGIILPLLLVSQTIPAYSQFQWTEPQVIDSVNMPSPGYAAVDDAGNLYVLGGKAGVGPLVERSTDHGATWSVSWISSPEYYVFPRQILADHQGRVWVLWESMADEFSLPWLTLSLSEDQGRSFSLVFEQRTVVGASILSIDAQDNVYLFWLSTQVLLTRFRQGDINQRIDTVLPNDSLACVGLASSPDLTLFMLFHTGFIDPATGEHTSVWLSSSCDTGASFGPPVRVDTTEKAGINYVQDDPLMAIDSSGTVYVSYRRVIDSYSHADVRLVRSTDGGQTFSAPVVMSDTSQIIKAYALGIDVQDGANFGWSHGGLMYRRSTDHGATFAPAENVGPMSISQLVSSRDGYLYAFGYPGFSRTNVILSAPEQREAPVSVTLFANYPNPFNSSTQIRYSLAQASDVDLRVYDILGRELDCLNFGHQSPGMYTIEWNGGPRSSGVYLVQLTVDGIHQGAQRMVLLR